MTVSPAENVAAEYTPDSRYNRPVVYLIDASVYVFRAYHSLPPDMTDRDGHPVHAVFGFARFLCDLLERAKPRLIAVAFDESGRVFLGEPAVLHRLLVKFRAGIRRGQRHLDGVRVDLRCELDGFLDGLLRLPGQAEDEGAVDLDAEVMAVLGELAHFISGHALLDAREDVHAHRADAVAHGLERHAAGRTRDVAGELLGALGDALVVGGQPRGEGFAGRL